MKSQIKQRAKAQGGFTLIEIIAVLVILGILAAVAVPKFTDLQQEARTKGLEGLVSAAQSQLHMEFAKELLIEDGSINAAYTNVSGNATELCNQVSSDGWLSSATLSCSGTPIAIKATYETRSASGTFSEPN